MRLFVHRRPFSVTKMDVKTVPEMRHPRRLDLGPNALSLKQDAYKHKNQTIQQRTSVEHAELTSSSLALRNRTHG
jgi:hypothetical protein